MSEKPKKYDIWTPDQRPNLDIHSHAKHGILRDYIRKYLNILCKQRQFGMDKFKITLVDGFAGGGLYEGGELGSPLILLETVEQTEAELNNYRQKKIQIDAHFYFIEKKLNTFNTLAEILQSRYQAKIGKTIHLLRGKFEKYVELLINAVNKRHPRGGGRVIFFLDQTGHTAIHPNDVNKIIKKIPHAELIIYISIDWFIDFINDDNKYKKTMQNLGLDQYLDFNEISYIKREKPDGWRYVIEAKISKAWQQATGAKYFRPFFIEPEYNHRAYWLLHLSPHPAAHDAMTELHWERGNDFRHYGGGLGCNILGYKPQQNYDLPGTSFDDRFREDNIKALMEDFMKYFSEKEQIPFGTLIDATRNCKAATTQMCADAVIRLAREEGEIEIIGANEGKKRNFKNIESKDIIRVKPNKKLI